MDSVSNARERKRRKRRDGERDGREGEPAQPPIQRPVTKAYIGMAIGPNAMTAGTSTSAVNNASGDSNAIGRRLEPNRQHIGINHVTVADCVTDPSGILGWVQG